MDSISIHHVEEVDWIAEWDYDDIQFPLLDHATFLKTTLEGIAIAKGLQPTSTHVNDFTQGPVDSARASGADDDGQHVQHLKDELTLEFGDAIDADRDGRDDSHNDTTVLMTDNADAVDLFYTPPNSPRAQQPPIDVGLTSATPNKTKIGA